MRQLVGPWKLFEVSSFFLFFCSLCPRKLCVHVLTLKTIILQTCHLAYHHLVNCHFSLENYHLAYHYLAYCYLGNYVFSFQRWAVRYRLITRGAEVNLKNSFLVRVHFDGLSFDEVSKDPTFSYHFPLHVS